MTLRPIVCLEFGRACSEEFVLTAGEFAVTSGESRHGVILYSRGFHTRFLYHYDVLYKALAAKLPATYQNEQVLAWSECDVALREWCERTVNLFLRNKTTFHY